VFCNGDIFWKNVEKACQVFFWLFLKLILVGSYEISTIYSQESHSITNVKLHIWN